MSPSPVTNKLDADGNPLIANKLDSEGNPVSFKDVQSATTKATKFFSGAPEKSLAEGGKWSDLIPSLLTGAASFIPGGAATRIIAPAVAAGTGELIRSGIQNKEISFPDVQDSFKAAALTAGVGGALELPSAAKSVKANQLLDKRTQASQMLEGARKNLSGGTGTPAGANTLEDKLAPIKSNENSAWQGLRNQAEANTRTFKVKTGEEPSKIIDPTTGKPTMVPIFEDKEIVGPIALNPNVKNYLDTIGKEIETLYPTLNQESRSRLAPAMSLIQSLQKNSALDEATKQLYIPFELAKELRSSAGRLSKADKQLNLMNPNRAAGSSRMGGSSNELWKSLTDDMTNSMSSEWTGADAAGMFANANQLTKSRVKAGIFDKIISKNTDVASGKLNVDKVINDLSNPASPQSTNFTAAEKSNLTRTLQAIKSVSPDYGGALTMSNGMFLIRSALSGPAHLAQKVAVAIGANEIGEKLLTDSKYAHILTQMPSLPPNSAQASLLRKGLFGMLKGTAVYLVLPDGTKIDAHIDSKGNPTPDFQVNH